MTGPIPVVTVLRQVAVAHDASAASPVEASVTFVPYVGPGAYVLSVKNVTTGSSFSTAQECNPSVVCWRGTAEWIVERPGGGKYLLAETNACIKVLCNEIGPARSR